MINKCIYETKEIIKGIKSSSTVLVGGFGECAVPLELIDALIESDTTDLTIASNNAGVADRGSAKFYMLILK
ncbi:MAG: CoA-transferase [Deferribacterota bacterium]|nr:CoA-transferase [Deferribacterota bacterium]